VSDLLATCRLDQYLDGLTKLGVESVEDMKELDPEDFELEVGMKKVEVKRLLCHLNPNSPAD
jgi:hypothetical protein